MPTIEGLIPRAAPKTRQVQFVDGGGGFGSSLSVTFPAPLQPGSAVVAICYTNIGAAYNNTQMGGRIFQHLWEINANMDLVVLYDAPGGERTVTVNWASGGTTYVHAVEVAGLGRFLGLLPTTSQTWGGNVSTPYTCISSAAFICGHADSEVSRTWTALDGGNLTETASRNMLFSKCLDTAPARATYSIDLDRPWTMYTAGFASADSPAPLPVSTPASGVKGVIPRRIG